MLAAGKDTGKVLETRWDQCYSQGWQGLITPQAFAH